MYRILSILPLLFLTLSLVAQTVDTPAMAQATGPEELPVLTSRTATAPVMNRMAPAFPGGNEGFTDFLATELDYPEIAREYAVEGTVVVEVEVLPTGKVEVTGVKRSLFAPLDEAALAAAARLPRMLPAVKDGVAISRTMYIPFRFSLR
jgi:TonB family protein